MQWYSERTFSSVITAKYLQTPCCHRFTELFMDESCIPKAHERDPHVTDYLKLHRLNTPWCTSLNKPRHCCLRETNGFAPYLKMRQTTQIFFFLIFWICFVAYKDFKPLQILHCRLCVQFWEVFISMIIFIVILSTDSQALAHCWSTHSKHLQNQWQKSTVQALCGPFS